MVVEAAALAATTVNSFLFPYVIAGAGKIVRGIADGVAKHGPKAAEFAAELTGKVWNAVVGAFQSDDEKVTLKLFQKNPDKMKGMLVDTLKEHLEKNPAFAEQLSDLVHTLEPGGTNTGAQIMNANIAGILDLRNADLSHAQNMTLAGVIVGDKAADKALEAQNLPKETEQNDEKKV